MATFKSDTVAVNTSAEKLYDKLSNFENLKGLLANAPMDQIPADKREMFDGVRVTSDSISFPAGPVGEITLQIAEKVVPTLIRLEGVGTPVALSLSLNIIPGTETSCQAEVVVEIAIPAMLKPMVAGPLQQMVDQFANVLRALPY